MGLDLHKLDHLVAVAEEGSFTRAAARLHMSQQALSTSVRTLERQVGVDLLDRGPAGVTLLPAGEVLVEEARVLHGVAHSAVLRARRIGRGETETLRIGHTPAVTGDEVTALLAGTTVGDTRVSQRYPDELTRELLAGELDLGLCRAMPPAHGLARTLVTRQRLRVAVAGDHPMAARDTVAPAELADHTIIVWGTPGRSAYTDLLIGLCRDAGFEPRIRRNPVQGTPPVTAPAGTADVAFVTAPAGTAAGGVRVVDLAPELTVPLHALWPQRTTSAARDAFLSSVD
ncbi:LysR family transcriptional regulator [Prauserella rugosa]|uniref:DNA-binding transcriptional LysR family regulator n=1 Tax=Prauserella rugosa TaxID=43354 RepID=A0A660CIA3_9PSEU|nr:LysR substrate-binding domain-containing protein [Prauserella rugosa]KMS85048.1 LysR family transcriptional regulator [Streptomyces regensis]TWH22154.1 DNA-binding transcriptional LysR family regulator [Prauserella rugosa]